MFVLQAELSAAIPKVGASSSSSASSPAVQELRRLMEQVDTIKAERDAMEQDLKVQQDDMGKHFRLYCMHSGFAVHHFRVRGFCTKVWITFNSLKLPEGSP